MVTALKNLGLGRTNLKIIKAIHETHVANILLNEEKQTISLKYGTRQWHPPCLLLLNIALTILARTIKQEKDIKVMKIGRS